MAPRRTGLWLLTTFFFFLLLFTVFVWGLNRMLVGEAPGVGRGTVLTIRLQGAIGEIAAQHSAQDLDIGAELYDLWLDSLLETVEETDPEYSPTVRKAWEDVMMVGIHYLCVRYNA